jgi:hypothetical protein
MDLSSEADFIEVTWDQCRQHFKRLAPDIYQAIEKISPNKRHRLFKVRYPYGASIIGDDGVCNIPYKGKMLQLNDKSIPKDIRKALGYNWFSIPMSLVVSGELNLYVERMDGVIETSSIYGPGKMVALRGVLDPPKSFQARAAWRMSSGSRTPFFIPSISNYASFERLRKAFDLRVEKPNNQHDHFQLITEIANHTSFPTKWHTELIFFSNEWLVEQDSDAWRLFYLSLLKIAWKASAYARNSGPVNRLWINFISGIRNKYVNEYILATVRHIIEASLGQATLYKVFDGKNKEGPFNEVIDVMLNIYGLKRFTPVVMVPAYFGQSKNEEAYVSLKKLSANWPGKASFENISLMKCTRLMRYVLKQFIHKLSTGEIKAMDTPFDTLCQLKHDFFFSTLDSSDELLIANQIFDENSVVKKLSEKTGLLEVPTSKKNIFLNSCIRIKKS